MTFRYTNCKFLTSSQPCKKSWVSWFTVNSQKVEIIMKSSKDCSGFILCQVTSCWCQLVWSIYHQLSKSIFLQPHTQSSHFSYNIASINHMISPSVHDSCPFRKINWDLIWYRIDWISNVPEVSPFSIEWWLNWCKGLIIWSVTLD